MPLSRESDSARAAAPRGAARLWRGRAIIPISLASAGATAAALWGAAGGGAERSGEPRAAPPEALQIADGAALAELLRRPHGDAARSLGPHRIRDRGAVAIDGGAGESEVELIVSAEIAIADEGKIAARTENSAGYARELIAIGGALFTRPGAGPYHRRTPERRGEALERASEMASTPAAYAAAIAAGAAIAERREATRAGRATLALELAPARDPADASIPAEGWDAERVSVREARGTVEIDVETGALVFASAEGALSIRRRDGTTARMRLDLSRELSRAQSAAEIASEIEAPPEDRVRAPLAGADPSGASGKRGAGDSSAPAPRALAADPPGARSEGEP